MQLRQTAAAAAEQTQPSEQTITTNAIKKKTILANRRKMQINGGKKVKAKPNESNQYSYVVCAESRERLHGAVVGC